MKRLANMLKALVRRAGELSPSCREASRLQSLALDRPLPLAQRAGLRIHLFLCRWCRRYGKQIRFLRSVAQHHAREAPQPAPQRLSGAARERLRRRLEAANE